MCRFVSFVIHRTDFEIFAGELNSHAGIEEGWGLKSDSYREADGSKEWYWAGELQSRQYTK